MKYNPIDYQLIDSTALQLRIDYCHFDKILDVFKLAKDLNINVIKYSSLTKKTIECNWKI